ncbi:DNA phosphorothioation-dependent restriction protein DptF [Pseudoalteromonas ruthenica]|uniref:DNA phosphorothioation-dependent restriction protein DptF n=1 Tax=Pseudoalteromonas ruthenica TaxID=151081 RepID=A0A5S3Z3I6_9GAMM|nr:DNA phosphorothioation-dependent restriction protein DptF [Pseudoalteromonas ruthenica]TMP86783.1 DNA phosphorothioation-dependent restriction protein DptF [Pseudoalteromonas ruthenica]
MRLKEALSVMSMASPYAVSTERSASKSSLHQQIKDYLYIEMPIEVDVDKQLSKMAAGSKEVFFLCGSSGDGKSELLTKLKKKYSSRIKFHLDATHSFAPSQNAIQTLDIVFGEYMNGNYPLVVGINTGMLLNYAQEGTNKYFKEAIRGYLYGEAETEKVTFISFEHYPKFYINEDGYTADFAQKFLERLTAKQDNLIRQLLDKDIKENTDRESKRIQANFALLSIPEVQKVIIELLFKARLMRDQFLTARALLDFVYSLIAGPGYLFDNLFAGGDNELANKLVDFDPAHIRTKSIDAFVIEKDLNLTGSEFATFQTSLSQIGIEPLLSSRSYLRLFYVLKEASFANDYHTRYREDFSENLIEQYVQIYQLHRDFNNSSEYKNALKPFYNKLLRTAIRKYNNRNAPLLDKGHYLIKELNGYQLVTELEVKADYKNIKNHPPKNSAYFTACLNVEGESLTIPVSLNLLKLVQSIKDGYRPNKHDKNTVVLLDELIEDISKVANKVKTLKIIKGDTSIGIKKVDEDEFEVSGI